MLTNRHHNRLTAPCHACGEPTFTRALRHADDLRTEVIALLGISERTGHACDVCVDRAEREIDGAADALELDADPTFATVCDARRDAWVDAIEGEQPAPLAWELAWCGDRDGDDAAVTGRVTL